MFQEEYLKPLPLVQLNLPVYLETLLGKEQRCEGTHKEKLSVKGMKGMDS